MDSEYPARLDIDYPDRELNRLSTFFRLIAIIPIAIIAGMVAGTSFGGGVDDSGGAIAAGGGILVLPVALMIIFRQRYPRWWFDWNLMLSRFLTRVVAYGSLMNDEYPSTEDEQTVHLELDYPDAENGLSRWAPLYKWFLLIPHYIVLFILGIAVFFAILGAWFAILFTGRYPKGLFDFVLGWHRWGLRVEAYGFLLTTDEYPPFSLEP